MSAYDDLMVDVVGNGRYQSFITFVVSWQMIVGSFHQTSSVFILGLPHSRCNFPVAQNVSLLFNKSFLLETFIPWNNATKDYSRCQRYDYNIDMCEENYTRSCIESATSHTQNTTNCTDGYYFDRSVYKETATTEWNLVCDKLYLMTFSSSVYYAGLILGAVIGGMAGDRFGRMMICKVGAILSFGSCLAISFSGNVYILIVLRFTLACFFMPISVNGFAYSCEVSKSSTRHFLGSTYNCVFGIGCAIFAGMAYIWRDWRELTVAISVLSVILSIPLIILPKSPGWLMSRGKEEEALRVCHVMAKRNKGKICKNTFKEAMKEADDWSSKVSLGELLKRPLLRFMLFSNAIIWFITSLVYYGLTLNVGALAGSVYVNQALGGVIEFVACLSVIPMIIKVGRTKTTVLSLGVSSASCLLSTAIIGLGGRSKGSEIAGVVVAMIGRFSASAAFAVIYQHTGELFPTPGRATALGVSSMAARIATIFTPFTLQLQYSWPWLTPTIFGILSAIGALLACVFPETRNEPVLTSFHQADVFLAKHFRNSVASRIFCLPKGNKQCSDLEEEIENLEESNDSILRL